MEIQPMDDINAESKGAKADSDSKLTMNEEEIKEFTKHAVLPPMKPSVTFKFNPQFKS